jgi:hypothetical protein
MTALRRTAALALRGRTAAISSATTGGAPPEQDGRGPRGEEGDSEVVLYDNREGGKVKFRLIGAGSLLHAAYWVQHKSLVGAMTLAQLDESGGLGAADPSSSSASLMDPATAELIGSLGLTSAVAVIFTAWLYAKQNVAVARYLPKPHSLEVETFNLWGGQRPPQQVSLKASIEMLTPATKSFLQFRPPGNRLYFLVDKKGKFSDYDRLFSLLSPSGGAASSSSPAAVADLKQAQEQRRLWWAEQQKRGRGGEKM